MFKRILAVTLTVLVITASIGCAKLTDQPEETSSSFPEPPAPTSLVVASIKPDENGFFAVQYIKTDSKGVFSQDDYAGFTIVRSAAEFKAYVDEFSKDFDFESEFNTATEKYDDAFFQDNALILLLREEAAGAGASKVASVDKFADYLAVNIEVATDASTQPEETASAAMEQWHIIIEMKASDIPNNDVTVFEY